MDTKTITIDGNAFSDVATFYDEIERKFTKDLGWKIGRNLNAFNDVLHGGFGVIEGEVGERTKVIWKNSEKSKKDLGYEAQAASYKPDEKDKERMEQVNPGTFAYLQEKYNQAMRHEGPTFFDDVVRIIRSHEDIELVLQ